MPYLKTPGLSQRLINLIALAGLAMATCPLAPAKSAQSEWILEQRAEEQGSNTVYISHDAVKIVNSDHGCQLVCKAPDWKVHCFNPADKIEWIGALNQFNGVIMANPFAEPKKQQSTNLKETGKGDIKGLKYTKYRIGYSDKDQLFTADDIAVDPMAAEFLARLYYTPVKPNIPVYRQADKGGGKTLHDAKKGWIDTDMTKDLRAGLVTKLSTSSWKKQPYNPADFVVPQGYKRIMDIIQISYNRKDKNNVNDMLNDIGFASGAPDLAKQNKRR